jgi:hypothetical protein
MNAKLALVSFLILCVAIVAGVFLKSRATIAIKTDVAVLAEPPGHGVVGTAATDKDPFDVTVTYTNDGYQPRDITIKKGQRVRFLNESNDPTWPASGVHPTHTLYPEKEPDDCLGSSFDACGDVPRGGFFDFTFYYVGTWTFHDHMHPFHSGSVTVQ